MSTQFYDLRRRKGRWRAFTSFPSELPLTLAVELQEEAQLLFQAPHSVHDRIGWTVALERDGDHQRKLPNPRQLAQQPFAIDEPRIRQSNPESKLPVGQPG